MSYHIQIELFGLPKIAANANGNWRGRMGEARRWKKLTVDAVVLSGNRPVEPLRRAKVICTRYAHGRKPDFENLAHSFKHVIDGLVVAGVLVDDNQDVIGIPEYRWEGTKAREGRIKVEVFEVAS